ncbi:MAG: aminomethyl-transferring glycine dehydrogenase subunit GcvPA [Methylocapsa sp.]|nr:aminomethyl-transferring glycine dehydrogenase subunit GcvPA [Methylocapsa sp.]
MRYLPLNKEDRAEMLARIGVGSIGDLFADIPGSEHLEHELELPMHKSEMEVERLMSGFAAKNIPSGSVPFFVGAGAYKHHIPATVDHLIQRSEFLTSYTPYQPEIAQGTLQTVFEFQTQVASLTAMDVANASMYDGSTSTVEAVAMARRTTKRSKAILSGGLHPHYAEAVRTYSEMAGEAVAILAPDALAAEDLAAVIDDDTACVAVQNPDFFGNLRDLSPLAAVCQEKGALLVAVFAEALSLGLIKPPGAMGADISAGEGQSIGNRLNFGGPYVGLFAAKQKYLRQMPGRLVGETVDALGRRSFVLTLSAREQHIRRDKATSNICTNSGLASLAFTIHLTLLGDAGLRRLARINHAHAVDLASRLAEVKGAAVLNPAFFNEFTVKVGGYAAQVVERMAQLGVMGGVPVSRLLPDAGLDDLLLVASTEVNTDSDRAAFVKALEGALSC